MTRDSLVLAVLRVCLITCSEEGLSGPQQFTDLCSHPQLLFGSRNDGLGDSVDINVHADIAKLVLSPQFIRVCVLQLANSPLQFIKHLNCISTGGNVHSDNKHSGETVTSNEL